MRRRSRLIYGITMQHIYFRHDIEWYQQTTTAENINVIRRTSVIVWYAHA